MESGGESKGGERKAGDSVSRCTCIVGVVLLEDGIMVVTGRIASTRTFGPRPGSVSVLALCCKFRCRGSGVSKWELSRCSTVNEERRRGTLTRTEDPRAEKVDGFGDPVDACRCEGLGGVSVSFVAVTELSLPSTDLDFLRSFDALLPILFPCKGELDSSS